MYKQIISYGIVRIKWLLDVWNWIRTWPATLNAVEFRCILQRFRYVSYSDPDVSNIQYTWIKLSIDKGMDNGHGHRHMWMGTLNFWYRIKIKMMVTTGWCNMNSTIICAHLSRTIALKLQKSVNLSIEQKMFHLNTRCNIHKNVE